MTEEERKTYQRDRMRKWRAANPDKTSAICRRYYEKNKEKSLASTRAWLEKNPDYTSAQSKKWRAANAERVKHNSLKRAGFTVALKEQRIAEQNGKCALCDMLLASLTAHQIHADHCHHTGVPRGVLCKTCNTNLGRFGDDPIRLRKAAEYLEKYLSA